MTENRSPVRSGGLLALGGALVATALPAQNVFYESVTEAPWSHGPGNWIDDIPTSESYFGKIDRLVSGTDAEYVSQWRVLEWGNYVARARFKKRTSLAGFGQAFEVSIERMSLSGARTASQSTLSQGQTLDNWSMSLPPLTFSVRGNGEAVRFRIKVRGNASDYDFDSFVLDRTAGLTTVTMIDISAFTPIHPQFYTAVPSDASTFGSALRLSSSSTLSWMQLISPPRTLGPGNYRASARLRKTDGISGRTDVVLMARDASNGAVLGSVTLPAAAQPVGTWVDTPQVTFSLPATTNVRFDIAETSQPNRAYEFLTLTIALNGFYNNFGSGCAGSAGVPGINVAQPPGIGQAFSLQATNLPPNAAALVATGFSSYASGSTLLPFDLGPLGATGCSVLIDPAATVLQIANGAGVLNWGFPIPNDPAFGGVKFYNQAFVIDGPANSLGLTTSNAGFSEIGY